MKKFTAPLLFPAGIYQSISTNDLTGFDKFMRDNAGKKLCVTVTLDHPPCSPKQTRYYWGVILERISQKTGYNVKACHHLMANMFLRSKVVIDSGNGPIEAYMIRSTKDLNTKEREEYHSQICAWASRWLKCWIPLPREDEP